MANTYNAIATVTVGAGGASNIEFTSIPNLYTDLQILCSLKTSRTSAFDNFEMILNGNTSIIYSVRRLNGNGSTASSTSETDNKFDIVSGINGAYSSDAFSNVSVYLPNYASGNNKTASFDDVAEYNNTQGEITMMAGLFSNTSAITSIKLQSGFNFVQYSTATLYGIKNS